MCECKCTCKKNADQALIDEFKAVRKKSEELFETLSSKGYKIENLDGVPVTMKPIRVYKKINNKEYF